MAKPNLWVLGKTKQLLDPNLQIAHFFFGYMNKMLPTKITQITQKSRIFQSSNYNKCPAKKFSHQPSTIKKFRAPRHLKKQNDSTNHEAQHQDALGLARRPQRGQRKQLRCNDSALRKRRASEAARLFLGKENMESSNISMDASRPQLATWLCLLFLVGREGGRTWFVFHASLVRQQTTKLL